MKFLIFRFLLLCLCVSVVTLSAWAHGGEEHSEDEKKPAVTTTLGEAGTSETSIQLRLADLSQSATGMEAPLLNAKIRGFLKRSETGERLSVLSAHAADAPGVYDLHFAGDQETFAFPRPGRYELDLNIQPARGEAVDTTVPLVLQAAGAAPATAAVPLWRRVLPVTMGLFALLLLVVLVRKLLAGRRGAPPTASSLGLLLVIALGLSLSTRVGAHGGEDHSGEEEKSTAPIAIAPTAVAASDIQLGEVTTTAKAGKIGITLTARTKPGVPRTLAPGEVTIAPQTAALLQIKTQEVQVAQLATGINFSGQIAANPNGVVRVASMVPGRITRLIVAQGDQVRQGQVVAVVESRAIGEAQSAYQQAQARFANAQSNLSVVLQQARAGFFSRAPLETAQKAQAEAAGDVREQQATVAQAQVALNNATRLARAGGFANPALEAAQNNEAQAREALKTAQAAQSNAQASVEAAQAELARRRQLAASGAYVSRVVEESRRVLVAAQSARAAAQSEIATTRANLSRAKTLAGEGLISQRDLEAAQNAFDTAAARLETAQADERTAKQELERQQQVGASNVNNVAEVQQAQGQLSSAQADIRTREAEAERAASQLKVASGALKREQSIFGQNIANRREIETARGNVQVAQAGLYKANRSLEVANAALGREQTIFRRNLNNIAQVQQARAGFVQAQADLRAAGSTLTLLKSSPGASVAVPIRAPLSGVVQTRDVAVGELIQADAPLLTIVNLEAVALEAALFEADFARVRIGLPVRVTADAAPGRVFNGRISFLGAQADPQTRTITARALIDNPGPLRPGMFARGQIQTGVGQLSLTVPASAVLEDGAAKVVFVAKGGKYQRREVTIGNESNGRIEVKSGLKQGESVVTDGAPALRAQAAKS